MEKYRRLPSPADGIEFHFCRNVACANFGQPPSPGPKWAKSTIADTYRLSGGKSSTIVLICKLCGTSVPVKSNAALAEELNRLWSPLTEKSVHCPTVGCLGGSIRRHGTTQAGQARYRCLSCGKTFTLRKRVPRRSRRPGLDAQILTLLTNKVPMRRICEAADVGPAVLYNQIDRCHELAVRFAARHERRLLSPEGAPARVYLAVDRQEHIFNWGSSLDRRNVVLRTVASSDNNTGYVFGAHLDFDPNLEPETVERQAILAGDYDRPYPFRKFARVWLQQEYTDAFHTLRRLRKRQQGSGSMVADLAQTYRDADSTDAQDAVDQRLPSLGMQVHSEYTLYAHFWFLARLLRHVEKIRVFMDLDTGMRAACLGAFAQRVQARTIDVFFVRIRKDLTVSQKKTLKSAAEHRLRVKMQEMGSADRGAAIQAVMEDRLREMIAVGDQGDRWLLHPFPDMSEPEKAVCHLTPHDGYDTGHLAALYRKASLHSIDKFFMQVRRRLSVLERPVRSANAARVWHGYSAYNPAVAARLLDLFRIVHNYVLIGQDGRTPAMRLGLASGPYRVEELLSLRDVGKE